MGLNLKEPLPLVKEEVNSDGYKEIGMCFVLLFSFFTFINSVI